MKHRALADRRFAAAARASAARSIKAAAEAGCTAYTFGLCRKGCKMCPVIKPILPMLLTAAPQSTCRTCGSTCWMDRMVEPGGHPVCKKCGTVHLGSSWQQPDKAWLDEAAAKSEHGPLLKATGTDAEGKDKWELPAAAKPSTPIHWPLFGERLFAPRRRWRPGFEGAKPAPHLIVADPLCYLGLPASLPPPPPPPAALPTPTYESDVEVNMVEVRTVTCTPVPQDKHIAFASISRGDAQQLAALAYRMQQECGGQQNSIFPARRFRELSDFVPDEALQSRKGLQAKIAGALAGPTIPSPEAGALLIEIFDLMEEVEAIYRDQQGSGAGSSSA